jgi:hypothetical protein
LLLMGLVILLHGLAWLIDDALDTVHVWLGFLIVFAGLLAFAALAALIGLRWIRRGAPPKPDMAIEEARRTRELMAGDR